MVKVIAGLGNPGRDYDKTRHNVGFAVVDELVSRLGGTSARSRFRAQVIDGVANGVKYVTAKPQMYMNLSGIPVREIMNWYKADLEDLLVVHDDMDLPLGTLRLRESGSAGGHNGIKSIIAELGTQDFARLRIGIGRGGGASVAHVLSQFTADEARVMTDTISEAADAVQMWAERGAIETMNIVNRPRPAAEATTEETGAVEP
ncbi:MAG: aminoacyl-tRNA hydrolase [Chloroflexota bacterium]|nr:aminoacyl-tRNA hydrolase [Chloroflexota bacterium]